MDREQLYESFDNGVIGLDDIIDISQKDGYNQALEDTEKRFKEWLKSEYGMVADEDMLTIRVLRSLSK